MSVTTRRLPRSPPPPVHGEPSPRADIAPPHWLAYFAGASFAVTAGGLIAAMAAPGPIVGLAFPLGLLGIWATSRFARDR